MILASLIGVVAIAACKDRATDETTTTPRTGVPPQETAKSATGDMRTDTAPGTIEQPQGTVAQGTQPQGTQPQGTAQGTTAQGTQPQGTQPQGTAGDTHDHGTHAQGTTGTPADGTVAQGTQPKTARPSYRADLTGSKARGSARFESDDAGLTRVMIDVQDAPKGTYQVHVFDGSDCKAIESMETPFAGGPGVAGEGKMGTPGPKTTMALWKSLGTMDVDATGKGKIEVAVPGEDTGKMDQRLVVIFPEKDGSKKSTKQAIIACGPVKASTPAPAGSAG